MLKIEKPDAIINSAAKVESSEGNNPLNAASEKELGMPSENAVLSESVPADSALAEQPIAKKEDQED